MPFFLIILKLQPEAAVLTSLLIQTAGMGSSSYAYFKQNSPDPRLALVMLLFAMPGITLGAYIANKIKPTYIEPILGILVLTTAFLFVSSNQKYADSGLSRVETGKIYKHSWIAISVSVTSGLLSTAMGEWLIPIMRTRLSLKMSSAIATCVFITFGTSLFGAAVHLLMGSEADFSIVLWAVPGVIAGGQIGPRIAKRINERLLKEIFVFLLTLVGIHLIYNSY